MEVEASASADRHLDFHPGMGMRWKITRSTEETGGEVFESAHWYDAGEPGPPVHAHPDTDDTFAVVDGTLDVCIDGEWRSCGRVRRRPYRRACRHLSERERRDRRS